MSNYPPQGNLSPTIVIGEIDDATLVIESEGIASNDNDTTFPTSAAVKDYSDTTSISNTLTDGQILVGNGSNVATDVAVTGDISISNAGVVAIALGVIVDADLASGAFPNITGVGTIASGIWEGTVVASAFLDADTAHLTTTQTFSGDKRFDGEVSIGGAAVAGKTLAITIPDDTQGEGIIIQNTDGSIELRNGTNTANEFLAVLKLISSGTDVPNHITSTIPVANDAGTTPVLRLDARQADDTVVVTRPILGVSNNGTDQLLISTTGVITLATWQGVAVAEAFIADNAITLAKMAGGVDGNIISYDVNGDPVAIVTGTS
ncbi:hypothetical protein LCGC14_1669560, partial [marine sediment metagenome]